MRYFAAFSALAAGVACLFLGAAGGAARADEARFEAHPDLEAYWGDYRAPGGRLITIGRSPDDLSKMFVHDSATSRFAGLTPSGDGYCADHCLTRTKFLVRDGRPEGLILERAGQTVSARRVGYATEDISFVRDGVTFKGRLWNPAEPGRHPAVLLIGGSGKNTRDDFRVYPYLFARHGFVVLAFDKRGSGESGGDRSARLEGVEALAADNAVAVAALRARADVDPEHVGVLGISHGAWVAVEMAAQDPRIAFAIPVVGGGVPLWRATEFEVSSNLKTKGYSAAEAAEADRFLLDLFKLAAYGRSDEAKPMIDAHRTKPWFKETPVAPFADLPAGAMAGLLSAVWKDELSYDPAPRLAKASAPVFAVDGDRDSQVPATENLTAIRRAAGSRATTLLLPHANHWQSLSDGYTADMTFAPGLFDRLGAWLDERKRDWRSQR